MTYKGAAQRVVGCRFAIGAPPEQDDVASIQSWIDGDESVLDQLRVRHALSLLGWRLIFRDELHGHFAVARAPCARGDRVGAKTVELVKRLKPSLCWLTRRARSFVTPTYNTRERLDMM